MWIALLAAAFAADDTIRARGDEVGPCEPPAERCAMLVATVEAVSDREPEEDPELRVVDVTIDVRDLKLAKRSDTLVLRLAIPAAAMPPRPPTPVVEAPAIALLGAPWSTMNLPIDGGTILHSDGSSMTVAYADYSAPKRAAAFDAAITAAGWESTFKSDDGGMFSHTYSHHQETLTFSAMELAGRTTLSITRF